MKKQNLIFSLIPALFLAASASNAAITSPEPNSQLQQGTVIFEWEDNGADLYHINVKKNDPDGQIILTRNYFYGNSIAMAVPIGTTSIYVNLTEVYGTTPTTKTFYYPVTSSSSNSGPNMISPAPLSILDSTAVTFKWEDVGAWRTYVKVGSSKFGGIEYANKDYVQGSSITISNLPADGSAVYLRIQTYKDGKWSTSDFAFTTTY